MAAVSSHDLPVSGSRIVGFRQGHEDWRSLWQNSPDVRPASTFKKVADGISKNPPIPSPEFFPK
jgi:hypothetical protein